MFPVKKDGKRGSLQRYRCITCGYVFENKQRLKNKTTERFWQDYVYGKQTYKQLSERYAIGIRTVQRRIDSSLVKAQYVNPGQTVIVMDTCYFGRGFGVMVFRDNYTKKNIHWRYLKQESISEYMAGIETIRQWGWDVKGIVCDGKRGLFHAFGNTPVQMCQFHQVAIITRYITKHPKMQASIELKNLVSTLTQTDKESFSGALSEWFDTWKIFISEKTYALDNQTSKRKWHYTHHRLRSAYNSLKYNLPYLFTWYDNIYLNIPNTTNSIEAIFSNLKNKLRVHAGLKIHRKQKLIDQILSK